MTDNPTQEPAASKDDHTHRDEAILLVKNYTMASLAPAVFPVPLADLAALTAIQLKMLHALSEVYALEFSNEMGKAAITSLITSTLPVTITPILASMVKVIPGLGQGAGIASMLVLGGASTHALGMVFIRHFEAGGNFTDFDAQIAADYFKEEFEKGKKVVAELKQQVESKTQKANQSGGTPTTE